MEKKSTRPAPQRFPYRLIMGVVGSLFTSETYGGPLEDLQPGHWVELPCKNKIRNVLPSPVPAGNGPEKIIDAWNSGAYDTKRDRLMIWGGGHQDYQGNEIYAFDIATLTWTRITNPSSTPISVHTYDGIEYMAMHDKFFSQGGSTWPTGSGTPATHTFDLAGMKWERKANHPIPGQLCIVSAYDPATGTIIWDGNSDSNSQLCVYDVTKDTWTFRSNNAVGNYDQTAAFDSKRRIFLRLGGGKIHEYDFKLSGNLTARAVSATGPANIVSTRFPGIDYDPVADEFVGWSGGNSVYSLNMDTKTWTRTEAAGANPGDAVDQGTYNRWRYVPSKNVFLLLNSIDGNVFAYRHKAGAAAPKWFQDMLVSGGTTTRIQTVPGTGLGLSAMPYASGMARLRLTGLTGKELPSLSIMDSHGRTRVVLAGVASGSGAAEYIWKGGDTAGGIYFAEGSLDGQHFRTRLPASP